MMRDPELLRVTAPLARHSRIVRESREGWRARTMVSVLLGVSLCLGCGEAASVRSSDAVVPSWEVWADAVSLPNDELDGWVDVAYRHSNEHPAYEEGHGPTVCVDEAHFNYHTAGGIYWPFAELLRGDGYRVARFRSGFTREALGDCQILVIANAQARTNTVGFDSPESNWAYPHASALTGEEISELISWVRGGGALFLIADHAPWPAAVSDLALLLGVHMLDGYAYASVEAMRGGNTGMIVFGAVKHDEWRKAIRLLGELVDVDLDARYRTPLANPGELAPHSVVEGRNPGERIEWVVTFQGQAVLASDDWSPIMVFGSSAVSLTRLRWNVEDAERRDGPLFSVAGWLHGATRQLDQGRVAVLGEAAMCTAQFDDLDGEIDRPLEPSGFNAPQAPQNAQFCLNVMHWLSGLLNE